MAEPNVQVGTGAKVAGMPESLHSFGEFLQSARSLGKEIAFWRSNAKLDLFEAVNADLISILRAVEADGFDLKAHVELRAKIEEIYDSARALMLDVPFQKRVGLLRQPLLNLFQRIYVVYGLLEAIDCRLRRMAGEEAEGIAVPEDAISEEQYRAFRQHMSVAFPFWAKEEWNVYDYVRPR